jgi:hypothetical protein
MLASYGYAGRQTADQHVHCAGIYQVLLLVLRELLGGRGEGERLVGLEVDRKLLEVVVLHFLRGFQRREHNRETSARWKSPWYRSLF